jgi:integrase
MNVPGFYVHALRATAATNALAHEAYISKVQEWLGHANIPTTRLYERSGLSESLANTGFNRLSHATYIANLPKPK